MSKEGSGTHAGTKEREEYKVLVRDTILLLREERGGSILLEKPLQMRAPFPKVVSPKTSFVANPLPDSKAAPSAALQGVRSSHSKKIPPALSFVPAPVPLPVSGSSFSSSSFNISSHFPEISHIERPPDDTRAKENSTRWKKSQITAYVVLLSFGEKEEQLTYLKNLAKAIHTRLKPTKILDGISLEKEKRWETLFLVNHFELVIVPEAGLLKTQQLKQIVENPVFSTKTQLIVLTPALMQDKATLWKKICHMVKK